MEKFGKSQPVKRFEDTRFLTGRGRYVDSIAPGGALHAYVFRSPVAHARITLLELKDARAAPGVHLVLSDNDVRASGVTASMQATVVKNRDGSKGAAPHRPLLAREKVNFVGEGIALVIADTLDQARDAAELIAFDFDELPASLGLEPGGATIHEEAPGNLAFDWALGDENACNKAFAEATHVVEMELINNRVIVSPMEPRACFAEWDGARLHFCFTGQGVWVPKAQLADMLGLGLDQVRVTIPDVGGGFGMKAMMHPEYFLVAHAAMQLGHPVRWAADRGEAMLSDGGGRGLEHDLALAFDDSLKITAYRVNSRVNLGAYNSQFAQPIQTQLFTRVLPGVYDLQTTYCHVQGFFTNTTQIDAYRGAGRPEAIYAIERVMDHAARQLRADPWDLRRRNFIASDAFPYRSATGETYDVGDFPRVLARAETLYDRDGFATRRQASQDRGLLRGQGLCYYIESILGDPSENAKIAFNKDGSVTIFVGTQSNGQGHETVYAQFLSDQTGLPVDLIDVVQGDSDRIAKGGGTGGSRSVTTQTNATLSAVDTMIGALTPFVAEEMGVAAEEVSFDHETFRAGGSNLTPTLLEVAEWVRNKDRADLLEHEARATLPARSFPNGAHVAEVEIDPETGKVWLDRYGIVDDFGNLINPLLVAGQVHGGVAQGVGQALTEHVVHDDAGQLLTGSFMDYALPRADDLPMFEFETEPVPSTANVMGIKGCGEAGTVGAKAAVANAVADALWDQGVRQADMPFTPHRVWKMVNDALGATG